MFCPLDKCEWYSKAKPGGRKCYHGEPQCWRGWAYLIVELFKLRFSKRYQEQPTYKDIDGPPSVLPPCKFKDR